MLDSQFLNLIFILKWLAYPVVNICRLENNVNLYAILSAIWQHSFKIYEKKFMCHLMSPIKIVMEAGSFKSCSDADCDLVIDYL